MDWFNYYGLVIIMVVMIPNIVFAIKVKDGFENVWQNKIVELFEQVGRYGCFILMIFNIPGTWFGFWFEDALSVYIYVNAVMVIAYCFIWIICFNKNSTFRALSLSILPSLIFLFSGIMIRSILLIISAVIFMPSHVLISYKNAIKSS